MSINKRIIGVLSTLGYPVVPNVYTGSETSYITFNMADERAIIFSDDKPKCKISYVQIHLWTPIKTNNIKTKKQINNKLFQAGFTYPEVTELTENENKMSHIIFECQIDEVIELESED